MGNCLQSSDSEDINLVRNNSQDSDSVQNSSRESDDAIIIASDHPPPSQNSAPPAYEELLTAAPPMAIYHPSPGVSRAASELTEEEQIKIAQRIGLIQHLPVDIFAEASKTDKECIICMMDFMDGDRIRFLPCLHTFHVQCIDDWLMRSFTCPSCLEPVDSALLTSYDQHTVSANALSIKQQLMHLQQLSTSCPSSEEDSSSRSRDLLGPPTEIVSRDQPESKSRDQAEVTSSRDNNNPVEAKSTTIQSGESRRDQAELPQSRDLTTVKPFSTNGGGEGYVNKLDVHEN